MSPRRSRTATSGSSWTSRSRTRAAAAGSRSRPDSMERLVLTVSTDPGRSIALVDPQSAPGQAVPGVQPEEVEGSFRQALLRSHRSREFLGEVEAAAAHYCRALRQRGVAP